MPVIVVVDAASQCAALPEVVAGDAVVDVAAVCADKLGLAY